MFLIFKLLYLRYAHKMKNFLVIENLLFKKKLAFNVFYHCALSVVPPFEERDL